ncbi:Hydrogenase maturation factor HypA [Frankia sp. AiPs1]|uniref:hydrogenase maturation nickel metallochaperone HypA n=1 Tax=Frankia sp. AiPa1 TaxID=573492 RepID=UPI00202B2EC1|nr:hydrogenase maturation nickel metallochaperone HypA [Frankia sp. AiPa1]MCL9762250.1 hydrogenase maturation nickel metallochaperone HypA [Frankia sp. AiPa1]
MHELSICRSIADIVIRKVASTATDRPVLLVRLQVGALRQVVPATLVACWDRAWRAHPGAALLAGSRLEIDLVAARARCRACGTEGELARPFVRCTTCDADATHLTLTSGEEFLITSFDLAPIQPVPTALASTAPAEF